MTVMSDPRYAEAAMMRIGVLTPHAAPGPEVEFSALAPARLSTRIARVTHTDTAGAPSSPAALRTLTDPPLMARAVKELLLDGIDVLGYASTTSAYVIGFEAETAMLARLSDLSRLPVAATCSSALRALRVLEVSRVALIGAPWFDPVFNQLGAAYFTSQGFKVVSSESAHLSKDPREIRPAAVTDWISQHVDDEAEAAFIGGNGFPTVGAIQSLEAMIDRPVLTANQVLLWQLLAHADDEFTINGYGQLFDHKP